MGFFQYVTALAKLPDRAATAFPVKSAIAHFGAEISQPRHHRPASQCQQRADGATEKKRAGRAQERGHETDLGGAHRVGALREHVENGKRAPAHVVGGQQMEACLAHHGLQGIGQAQDRKQKQRQAQVRRKRKDSQCQRVREKRPERKQSFAAHVAEEEHDDGAEHAADGRRRRQYAVTRRADVKNIFREDRQQRAVIAKTDNGEVEQNHRENDRLGKKKAEAAENAVQRKFFPPAFSGRRRTKLEDRGGGRKIKQRIDQVSVPRAEPGQGQARGHGPEEKRTLRHARIERYGVG